MITRSTRSLLNLTRQQKIIPIVENRAQLMFALDIPEARTIFLQHCNLFEVAPLLKSVSQHRRALYVNVDHIGGIHPDKAGMRYLARHLHMAGIISINPRMLAQAKDCELETVQRIFAMDSIGLEVALDSVNQQVVDLIDIAPALIVPYISSSLHEQLSLPFMASGLVFTFKQVWEIIDAGALAVAGTRSELWRT
ncbi:MAG TPA: glycerol-3-phosphate responsive antiterminator [Ktedonobacteraceae bacterium]|nr:glycerol-3-phosphate responsive antiterminator [Ktedonobacteraceae bacterium]